jgi:hypothetical protein
MVNRLVVFSIFIYEPDTIESVHFAVVADSEVFGQAHPPMDYVPYVSQKLPSEAEMGQEENISASASW